MDRRDLDLPAQAGASRRQVLRAGAVAVGAATVWTAPAVSVLGLTPLSAASASAHGPGPDPTPTPTEPAPTCKAVIKTSASAFRVTGPTGTLEGPRTGFDGPQPAGSDSDMDTAFDGTLLPPAVSALGPYAESGYTVPTSSSDPATAYSTSSLAGTTVSEGGATITVSGPTSRAESSSDGTTTTTSSVARLLILLDGATVLDLDAGSIPFEQSGVLGTVPYAVALNETNDTAGTARAARIMLGDVEVVLAESRADASPPVCGST